jgi:hypothetical protein
MWWLYFRWQWLRDAYLENQTLQSVLAALFLVLGFFGGWVHYQRDRRSFWFFGPLMATLTLVLIYYLNFRYGHSQAPDLADSVDREVRDRDYFFLWSFSAWSVWAALGLVFVWESVAAMVGTQGVKLGKQVLNLPTRRSWMVASPVLAIALFPLIGNWQHSTRHGDTSTRDFAHDLLNSVEPYGILVTVGDNDTFPLWYAQEVEGIRRDVVIANTSLLNTDWYVRQIIRSPIRDYEPAKGPEIYKGRQWARPASPPLRLTLDEADAIPLAQENRDTVLFSVGKIRAVIRPRIFTKADYAVLLMIRDNPDRPIYFARTSGGYGHELGFGPYLVMQGLARKLLPEVPIPGRDTSLVPGEGWVDLPRSRALWDSVFLGPQALISKGGWPDRASVGIPALYVNTGLILAEALESAGEASAASTVMARTEGVARATRINEFFSFVNQRGGPLPLPGIVGDSSVSIPVPSSAPPGKRDSGTHE